MWISLQLIHIPTFLRLHWFIYTYITIIHKIILLNFSIWENRNPNNWQRALISYLIFTVSPVQVWSNAIVHLLFFSQIEFFKNAQKPYKNAVKTDCIYFDRKFWTRWTIWIYMCRRRSSKKVGNEPKALWGRLQPNSRREYDLLRKRRSSEEGDWFFMQ